MIQRPSGLSPRPKLAPVVPAQPGQAFAWLCIVLFVTPPLFFLGLLFCAGRNIEDYLARSEQDVVFRVLLKPDVREKEARAIALEWTKSDAWRDAQVVTALAQISKIEELSRWTGDVANQDLMEPLPLSIDLQPRAILSSRIDPSHRVATLKLLSEVDQVFYDAEGVRWLRQVALGWRGAKVLLGVALGLCALGGALAAGWLSEKIRRAGAERPGGGVAQGIESPASPLLACSGGVLSIAALGVLYGLLRWGLGIPVLFLGPLGVLALVGLGAALGGAALAAPFWTRSRLARALLPMLVVVCIGVCHGARFAAAEQSEAAFVAPASPALPPASDTPATGLSADSSSDRERLVAKLNAQIAQKERAIRYLDEWLSRSEEERRLDRSNRELHQIKTDMAMLAMEYSRKAMKEHQHAAAGHCAALHESLLPAVKTPANGALRSRREMVARVLTVAAGQALFLLDIDRREQARGEALARQLNEEQKRLDAFAAYANLAPDAVEQERRRLALERVSLSQRRALAETNPAAAAEMRPIASVSPDEDESVFDRSAERPSGSYAGEFLRADLGRYVFLPTGSLIHAVQGGAVLFAGRFTGFGETVILDHGEGLTTVYAFLGEIVVKSGQKVKAGEYLGSAGVVKPQGVGGIRFEARRDGRLTPLESLPGVDEGNLATLLQGK
jgi:murein DD-endopeptidase MepM/ murein hydrolase activator NlpD